MFRQVKIDKIMQLPLSGKKFNVPIAKGIVVVDFEAYVTAPLVLSEIGAVRVQDGKIVAKLHGFF